MKKKLLVFLMLLFGLVLIAGCGTKKETEEKKKEEKTEEVVGGWELVLTDKQVAIDSEALKAFEKATKDYEGLKLEAVTLLGKQVVAGTNYMYLAKGYESDATKATYKVVVVYKDLKGNASVSSVSNFDVNKFAGTNIEAKNEDVDGGWNVVATGKALMLDDEKVQAGLDKATETLTGMDFNPIAVVGKQVVAGTNYAILCYGKGSYQNAKYGVYVVTLYQDLEGNNELTYIAYVDLAQFNK